MIFLLFIQSMPDPTSWDKIIKAVTDPFSLLALIVLVLGVVALQALKGVKAPWARIVILLIIAGSLLGLGLNVTRVTNLQAAGKTQQASKVQYSASITFRGSHHIVQSITVPFQSGSGQVNFGCGESAHPSVRFNVPQGAHDVNASAAWVNTDNVKSQDQQAVVTGETVVGSGNIAGKDRDWIGNCPGGGHGELVIRGTYVIDQPGAPEPLTKAVQAVLEPGVPKTFDLPSESDQATESCEIAVSSAKGPYAHAQLHLTKNGDQTQATTTAKEGKIQATVENSKLTVQVD